VLFNSLEYLIFLPLTWIAFWSIRSRRIELMLIASYVFYASWSIPYAAMVFGLVIVNYLFGLALARAHRRRLLLGAFIAFDLGVLAVFKYLDFGVASVATVANTVLGVSLAPTVLGFVLPLGISFFTFEFIHYLVDIYRGDLPVHSFSKFHVFIAFFPTQIAGPIKRFQQFVPSLASLEHFDAGLAREGIWLIGRGLMKKVLLADRLGRIASTGFQAADLGAIGMTDAWISTLAFSLQIFLDFSGYTDIARGSAALFGFRIPINFDAPYLAASLADFWRRWHISLSSWLRDYVYIPLGGSRRPLPVVVRNLLVTMLLGGLWHGAAWHFVVWGGLWGTGLVVDHLFRGRIALARTAPGRLAGWLLTQLFVLAAWTFFRAHTLGGAVVMLLGMTGQGPESRLQTPRDSAFVVGSAVALLAGSLAGRRGWRLPLPAPDRRLRPVLMGAAASVAIVVGSALLPATREPFIYFQF
jgi:D-alanyl-lipoteichoic acid acyltransferase DltB (MBOAT superfamily)